MNDEKLKANDKIDRRQSLSEEELRALLAELDLGSDSVKSEYRSLVDALNSWGRRDYVDRSFALRVHSRR